MIDRLFGDAKRLSYRGLVVFAAATALLVTGTLTGTEWVAVAMAFMALDKAGKVAAGFLKGR